MVFQWVVSGLGDISSPPIAIQHFHPSEVAASGILGLALAGTGAESVSGSHIGTKIDTWLNDQIATGSFTKPDLDRITGYARAEYEKISIHGQQELDIEVKYRVFDFTVVADDIIDNVRLRAAAKIMTLLAGHPELPFGKVV